MADWENVGKIQGDIWKPRLNEEGYLEWNIDSNATPPDTTSIVSVVEEGEEGNHRFIKYSDGTMVCSGKIEDKDHEMTEYQTIYRSTPLERVNFLRPFIGLPTVTASTPFPGDYGTWLLVGGNASELRYRIFALTGSNKSIGNIYYHAQGRWR